MIRTFRIIPAAGRTFTYDGQRYRLVGSRLYTRRSDGSQTPLLIWSTRCPVCDEVFETETTLTINYINRRCKKHKAKGVPVNPRTRPTDKTKLQKTKPKLKPKPKLHKSQKPMKQIITHGDVQMDQFTPLCLDLGTTTGWAIQSKNVITSGTVNFKNSRFEGGGMRFLKFTRFLSELHSLETITQVYFEEVRRHMGVDAAHAYGGFLAHLSAWCEEKNIPYQGVPVGTIKKHATGKGNASKAHMMLSAKQRGHHPADDSEADALALLYWAKDNMGVFAQ